MKKLFALGLTLCSLLSACKQENNYTRRDDDQICGIPVRYLEDLVVNNSDSFRTVIEENEKEGVQEMLKLVKSSPLEEAWAYLPKKQKWIEIGRDARPEEEKGEGKYRTELKLDVGCLKTLMEKNDSLIVYHFHPEKTKAIDDLIKKREQDGNPLNEQEISRLKTGISVQDALPSDSDLSNMIGNSLVFYENNPKGAIEYKVVSSGVTKFSLTEEGKREFREMDELGIKLVGMVIYKKTVAWGSIFSPELINSPVKRIRIFCEIMNNDYISVSYNPVNSEEPLIEELDLEKPLTIEEIY